MRSFLERIRPSFLLYNSRPTLVEAHLKKRIADTKWKGQKRLKVFLDSAFYQPNIDGLSTVSIKAFTDHVEAIKKFLKNLMDKYPDVTFIKTFTYK